MPHFPYFGPSEVVAMPRSLQIGLMVCQVGFGVCMLVGAVVLWRRGRGL